MRVYGAISNTAKVWSKAVCSLHLHNLTPVCPILYTETPYKIKVITFRFIKTTVIFTVMSLLATMLLVHEGLLCSMNIKVITHLISLPLSLPEHGRPFEESLGSPSDGSAVSGHMQGPEELVHWPA